ncbi:glycoside hydrolase domain-containing protein [Fibrobacterota bacterium]
MKNHGIFKISLEICFLMTLMLSAQAGAQVIWAVHDGERLERDDLNSPNKPSNFIWDGNSIRIFGARNEVIAFQVIVEATNADISSLSASLPRLDLRGGTASIVYNPPGEDPTDYVDRPIHLFSTNYINVTEPTSAGWVIRGGEPEDPTGWKPVQLVPENARAGRGGFPLEVAAGNNQGLWIDIYTERDLPAGIYEGTVTVETDGNSHDIPLQLELFDFTLPDTNGMNAMVYWTSGSVSNRQGSSYTDRYHRFAHRNRIELVNRYSVSSMQSSSGRFDGDDFTRDQGYAGPGEGVGNVIAPRSFYSPGSGWDSQGSAWDQSDEWMSYLNQNLDKFITFLYMPDEPSSSEFDGIRRIADNIHSNSGPGRDLPIFITHSYTEDLDGAIDIWCSTPRGYNIEIAEQERLEGRDYWWYNGGRPSAGAFVYDTPPTDARMAAWASFKHDVIVHFYWHATHWNHNSQYGGDGSRTQNVWLNPVTFDNGGSFANGDGVLVYPGQEEVFPDQDRGIAGPISCLRMANYRRGFQDHLYLTMARDMGKQGQVDQALETIVPSVLSDAGSELGFSDDGNVYEETRYQLAQAIAPNRGVSTEKRIHTNKFSIRKTTGGDLLIDVPQDNNFDILLWNLQGKILRVEKASARSHVFSTSSLVPGLYLMECKTRTGSFLEKVTILP